LTLTNPQDGALLGAPSASVLLIRSVDPLVQFGALTYKATEGGKDPVIEVVRSGPRTDLVTVHYDVSGGSAAPGVDYVPASGDLTFAAGATRQQFPVHLLVDPAVEEGKTVNLSLSAPTSAGLGARASATLLIASSDPGVSFKAAVYKVAESAPKATITVKRTAPLSKPASVEYETADGTATAGVDYQAASGVLSFAKGTATRTFLVNVINDTLDEPGTTPTVSLTLKNPDGAYLAAPSAAILQIGDNDVAGIVQFAVSDYSVAEADDVATITVARSGGSASGVAVHYATSDGTAVAGSNYVATSGTLIFNQGDASRTFTIPVLDDGNPGNKTVHLTLTSPQGGATLGAKAEATLWIVGKQ
jgi:Calx-beta domain